MSQAPLALDDRSRRAWMLGAWQHVPILATIVVFVLLYSAASWRYENFLTWRVFENLLRDNAVLGLAAIGMTFVILSGGIDLSVGALVGLVSIGVAVLIERVGVHPALALPLALAAGTLFGAGQGALITFFALPPFLVTLAGLFMARGLAFAISEESISIRHPLFGWVGDASFEVFPLAVILLAMVLLAAMWIAHQSRFGRAVYAIGGSESSALLMGVPVQRTKVLVYAASGFCAALAGVSSTFYLNSGGATTGQLLELDAIAAVVIGGTLLSGGVGYVAGTLVGVLIFGTIQTILAFDGRSEAYMTRILIGALLLGFILLQKLVQSSLRLRIAP